MDRLVLLCAGVLAAGCLFAADWEKDYADDPVVLIRTSEGDIHAELFASEAPKTVANFLALAEGTKEWTDPQTGEKKTAPFYDGLTFHRVIKDFMLQGGCPLGTGTGGPGYTFEDEINAADLGLADEKAFDAQGQPNRLLGIRRQEELQQRIVMPATRKVRRADFDSDQAWRQALDDYLKQLTIKDVFELQGYRYDAELKSHPPKRGVLAMANSGPNTNGSQFFINQIDTPWLAGKHTVFGKVLAGMDVVDKIARVPADRLGRPERPVKILSIRRVQPAADQ